MESWLHKASVFTTLTYDESHLPENGSLCKKHPTDWLKRLRKRSDLKIRYFLCGEYGDQLGRPHYHAVIFGLAPDTSESGCQIIADTWPLGFTSTREFTPQRAAYTAHYVTKKIISRAQPDYGDGRLSEYATMSRRPGLGRGAISMIADRLTAATDVTNEVSTKGLIRIDGKQFPMDRYIQDRTIDELQDRGIPEDEASEIVRGRDPLKSDLPFDVDQTVQDKLEAVERSHASEAAKDRRPRNPVTA